MPNLSAALALNIGVILIAFVLTLGFTGVVLRILRAQAVLDRPNERSSHKEATPRGGGLALLAVLIPGMIVTAALTGELAQRAGLIAGTVVLALISWQDDRKGTGVIARLSLHIFAACLGSLAFAPQETLFGGAVPFWLDRLVLIVGWAWFVNLYNFMDGIDGITCAETVALATGACLIADATALSTPFMAVLTLLLTGAGLGFLAYNWHPAKLFLGDVGSVPLGYLAGFALLTLAVKGYWAPALILPLYYLADSGFTIAARALRGEKIWQAHREPFLPARRRRSRPA